MAAFPEKQGVLDNADCRTTEQTTLPDWSTPIRWRNIIGCRGPARRGPLILKAYVLSCFSPMKI